ncbi:MAG: alkaline phosphatase family protein [Acidobacteriaceae bacterium]|nr:alkaline phosphatase family protein [Acidobacteriaceae bacterium]
MSAKRVLFVAVSLLLTSAGQILSAESARRPKLVVAIMVDQFRYDYLTRFRSEYHGGLDRLMTHGADFTNAFYEQVPTVTAVGHSIFMSGAMPAVSGIVGNSWYDRDEGKVVTSVCDWNVKLVGAPQSAEGPRCTDSDPASPRRLLVSTIGDELRDVSEHSKVIGISIKPRGAILPSGHRAAGAFWFDDETGNFSSSTFYMDTLPAWAATFNERKLPDEYVSKKWEGFQQHDFHASPGQPKYSRLPASPWGNELIEAFSEDAIRGEKLGQRGATDLLTISFSSNDYVGHAVGPDAPEVRDMSVRTDQLLDKLFQFIDSEIGLKDTLIVLSADHGVAPLPAVDEADKMPGGYIAVDPEDAVETALRSRFGTGEWVIAGAGETTLYLTRKKKGPSDAELYSVAREALFSTPLLHVARVYTRDELDKGVTGDFIARALMNGYYPRRSGDVFLIFEPNFMPGSGGTTHFSPYNYDTHVPILFMGPGIKPGRYDERITPNDIAPTLATILSIQTPNGSSGRVLTEMLSER